MTLGLKKRTGDSRAGDNTEFNYNVDIIDNAIAARLIKPNGTAMQVLNGQGIPTAIVDNLSSTSTENPLSANQGKVLQDSTVKYWNTIYYGNSIDIATLQSGVGSSDFVLYLAITTDHIGFLQIGSLTANAFIISRVHNQVVARTLDGSAQFFIDNAVLYSSTFFDLIQIN